MSRLKYFQKVPDEVLKFSNTLRLLPEMQASDEADTYAVISVQKTP